MATLQQRFERTRAGRIAISVFIALFVGVGVVFNIPESPIRGALEPALRPVAAAVGLDQYWGMYGKPTRRAETVEVQVQMADGSTRVWTLEEGAPGIGWWDRWIMVRRAVMTDAQVRPQVARWVARATTKPGEHAVAVSVVLHTRNLSAPGGEQSTSGSTASKILYQETLAAPQ